MCTAVLHDIRLLLRPRWNTRQPTLGSLHASLQRGFDPLVAPVAMCVADAVRDVGQ